MFLLLFVFSDVDDQCLQIKQRTNNILELIFNNCPTNTYRRTLTFIQESTDLLSCTISIGHLLVESNLNHRRQMVLRKNQFQMSIGCDNKEKLMMYQIGKGA